MADFLSTLPGERPKTINYLEVGSVNVKFQCNCVLWPYNSIKLTDKRVLELIYCLFSFILGVSHLYSLKIRNKLTR